MSMEPQPELIAPVHDGEPGSAPGTLSRLAQRVLAKTQLFVTPPGTSVVRAIIGGGPVFFTVANPDDRIQRKHMRGKFYEPVELDLIAAHFTAGGVFCDVGANVGNHSLYALLRLGAARVIPFEPNPAAYELYLSNMVLNGVLDRIETGTLGFGLTDRDDAPGMALAPRENNLGATQLVAGEEGLIPVRRGDDLLDGRRIDFLKIDVEGMELEVLRGLDGTIRTRRPPIFLEVDHRNRPGLMGWCAGAGYRLAVEGRSFKKNQNLLLLPDRGTAANA
jgi:FkbM family methyltransferase